MRVARDGRDARDTEVEQREVVEPCVGSIRDHERSKAAVNVDWDPIALSQGANRLNVVDDPVREVRRRASEQDSVAVDQLAHLVDVDFVRRAIHGDMVEFDAKVVCCLVKPCVCRLWDDHLWMADPSVSLTVDFGTETRQ